MTLEETLIWIGGILGSSGITFLIVVIYLIKNPEKIDTWASMFYRAFASVSKSSERNYMIRNIKSVITENRRKLDLNERGLQYGLDIKWTNSENIETDLKKGNIVVMMRPYQSQSINLANIISVYVPEALLPKSKKYIDVSLIKPLDHVISMSFLRSNPIAFRYYNQNFIDPLDQKLNETIAKLMELNNIGYLTRILISEYENLSSYYPQNIEKETQIETLGTFNTIYEFLKKTESSKALEGEGIFQGKYINMAIVPVGLQAKLEIYGIDKHFRFIKNNNVEGIQYFYVVSTLRDKTFFDKLIKKCTEELKFNKVFETRYEGIYRKNNTVLLCCLLESQQLKSNIEISKTELKNENNVSKDLTKTTPMTTKKEPDNFYGDETLKLIKKAILDSNNEDGSVFLSQVGKSIKKIDPNFDFKKLGFKKLSDLIKSYEELEIYEKATKDENPPKILVRIKT